MFYDKKIRYIDYMENEEKRYNCGYVKITIAGGSMLLEMQIKGLYETDDVSAEVMLQGAGAEARIGAVLIQQGNGSFRWQRKDPEYTGEGVRISEGLCYGQLERIHVQLSPRRSLRCIWRKAAAQNQLSETVPVIQESGKLQTASREIEIGRTGNASAEELPYMSTESELSADISVSRKLPAGTPAMPEEPNKISAVEGGRRGTSVIPAMPDAISAKGERLSEVSEREEAPAGIPAEAERLSGGSEREEASDGISAKGERLSGASEREEAPAAIPAEAERLSGASEREEAPAGIPAEAERLAGTYVSSETATDKPAASENPADMPSVFKQAPVRQNGFTEKSSEQTKPEGKTGKTSVATEKKGNRKTTIETQRKEERTTMEKYRRSLHGPRSIAMSEDKWHQLWKLYPHIRPFQDDREYLSLWPEDFVILRSDAYRLAHNSFLLHGYYNYEHLILTKMSIKGNDRYYLGVPGNFYEKEKQVAVMFGFESFECRQEPAQEGDFGYYMIKVEL